MRKRWIPVVCVLIVGMWFGFGAFLTTISPSSTGAATTGNAGTPGHVMKTYASATPFVNASVQVAEQDVGMISQFSGLAVVNEVNAPNYSGIVLVGQGYMQYVAGNAIPTLQVMQSSISAGNSFALVMFGGQQYRWVLFGDFQKALGANKMAMPIMPISSATTDKRSFTLDAAFMNAPVVEFTFNPFGVYATNSSFGYLNATAWMMNTYLQEASLHAVKKGVASAVPMTLTKDGYTFVGTAGWYTQHYYQYEFGTRYLLGWMSVKSDYYYCEQSTAQGTYYFFLDYPTVSAQGEITWWGGNWIPINYHSFMGWETSVWPGQQLFDWGPKNSGGPTGTISFGLQTTPPGASASVSYSFGSGATFTWSDYSYPAGGNASALETGSYTTPWGVTYTVDPTSVGELNPTLFGGVLPMIMHSYYGVDNQITTLYASWDVSLEPSGLSAYNVNTGIN